MSRPTEVDGLTSRLSPVERHSTVGAVAKQLLQLLTEGNFSPGTRLPPERQLATSLGVGRSTLREALAALDVLGLVDVRPGSGTYLAADSSELLPQAIKWGLMLRQPRTRDLVEVREYLEVVTARLAAERATDDDIARLRETVDAMRAAGDDVDAFVKADLAFHFEAARIAANTVLQDILHSIQSLLTAWFDRTLRVPGTIDATLKEHEAVFEAVATRSPDLAERRMKALMDAADARLKHSVDAPDADLEDEQPAEAV
jgi:GntR family transcriptional regulator, transcriptional repressor for pyruvate dehydrogenase complex